MQVMMLVPKLRLGLLGASRIAPVAVIAPALETGAAEIMAIAARDVDRASAFAQAHQIPNALTGYDALYNFAGLQAVYNALPISLHAATSMRALERGLHVLCEKPFAMTADEAREMSDLARTKGLILMEAFHYRYHPVFHRFLEVVHGGDIGKIERIEARFHAPIPDKPDEIRFDPRLGGGALMDLGTYCVHWCRVITGSEPTIRSAFHRPSPRGVDLATQATLSFEGGIVAELSCDMAAAFEASLRVIGTNGEATVINPLAPQYGHALNFDIADRKWSETLIRTPTYNFQLEAFVHAIATKAEPLTGCSDAIAQMAALDAIRQISAPRH